MQVSPDCVPTHLVGSTSRGFAWLLPLDGQGRALEGTPERHQFRPGVHAVVGDKVELKDGYVVAVAPRHGELARAVGAQRQLLAANVDRVVLVMAVGRALREGFLMRGLVGCTVQELPVLVVVNKMDLDEDGEAAQRMAAWQKLGIRCLGTQALLGGGLKELDAEVATGTTVFMGHSGVGKSSLINALCPGADRKTGGLDWQGKGKHVTTMAKALVRPGSVIIDLPGVREFGLWGASLDHVMGAFPDVATAAGGCRFSNCTHHGEPGCGVDAAVEAGELSPERADLCFRMLESVALGTEGGGRI